MPRLLPEVQTLRQTATTFAVTAAAGAALAGIGGLLSRWCADPALGWTIALAAAALGAGAGIRGNAPDEDGARAWAVGGALAALGVPALLRFLGLALADPARLQDPVGGPAAAAFVLGQAALLTALAALAWTRAGRARGARAGAAALLGAAAGAAAFRRLGPAAVAAAAALIALSAAELAERPWSRRDSAPLRSRVFAAAAAAGLLLAWPAPGLLADVWMARLHGAYPGGGYLALADDGAHEWAAYLFSTGDAVSLRDGVIQSVDSQSARLAVHAVLGQHDGPASLLILNAPQPNLPVFAAVAGATVAVEGLTSAQEEVFDALMGGTRWRTSLAAAPPPPTAALLVVPRPFGARSRRAAGPAALKALRARLPETASLAVLISSGAPAGTADAVAAAAAAAFGFARVADLPRAVLVIASSSRVEDAWPVIRDRLSAAARASDPDGTALASGLLWRAPPSAK